MQNTNKLREYEARLDAIHQRKADEMAEKSNREERAKTLRRKESIDSALKYNRELSLQPKGGVSVKIGLPDKVNQ